MSSLVQSSEALFSDLQEQLAQVKNASSSPLEQSKAAIPICLEHVRLLRKHLKTFRNIPRDQEIDFFKQIKPRFVSAYFFQVMIYRLHYSWPMGDLKSQQFYLKEKLLKIKRFFDKHYSFYCYYRTNSTHLDKVYFLRGQQDVEPSADHLLCGTDPGFYTSRDLMLAKMLANNQFQAYLLEEISQLQSSQPLAPGNADTPALTWTASKTDLMEMIYGVYLSNAVNNGQCEIKTIATIVCKAFNVEINHYYDYIYHLKMRKCEPTKYTDRVRQCLLQNFSSQLDKPERFSPNDF